MLIFTGSQFLLTHQLCQLDVGRMAGLDRENMRFHTLAHQEQVACHIHHLVADQFIGITHAFFADDGAIVHQNGVVQTAAFRQTGGDDLFQFPVDRKGAGAGKFFCKSLRVDHSGEVLKIQRRCPEFHGERDLEIIGREQGEGGSAVFKHDRRGTGPVFGGGVLLLDAGVLDHIKVRSGGAVGDGRFGPVHLHNGVIHIAGMECCHDVFDCDHKSAGFPGGDRGGASDVDHIFHHGFDFRFSGHIHPAENDPGIFRSRQNTQVCPRPGMQCDPRDRTGGFNRILHIHKLQSLCCIKFFRIFFIIYSILG